MNSLDEIKIDHVYQLTRDIVDIDTLGPEPKFLARKGDVVVSEEIDLENGVVIVRAEKFSFPAEPSEIGPLGIENFELEPPPLSKEWCKSDGHDGMENVEYFEDGACTCGCYKHHYHCMICRKIVQIG